MRHGIHCLALTGLVTAALGLPGSAAAQSVEELKRQMQELQKRIERLEKRPEATSSGEAAITSGNKDVRLAISGQVNRGVLFADNGTDSEVFHVDNDNSSTRIRFIGEGVLDEDITVGTQVEVQFESNSTAAISFEQDGPAGPNNFSERKLELYVDSKRFGRVWLGQGDTASNGTSEKDLSGTSVVGYSGIADLAGGLEFRGADGTLGPGIGTVFSNLDGLSRDDRIRYDTPSFEGFKASISAIDGGAFDAALHFAGAVRGTKIAAGAAYANSNSRGGFDRYNGSVSVLFPFGLSLTAALGMDDTKGRGEDPTFYYGKVGYTFNATKFGSTSVAIDFTEADDVAADGDEFRSYGAFLVQNVDRVATELYLGVRNHELDRPSADFDDVIAVLGGARVKF